MAEGSLLLRTPRLEVQLNDIMKMLPVRSPQELSRLLYAKSELEFLLGHLRRGVDFGVPDPLRTELLGKIHKYPILYIRKK